MKASRKTEGRKKRPYRGKSKHSDFRDLCLASSPLHKHLWTTTSTVQAVANFIETKSEAEDRRVIFCSRVGASQSTSGAAFDIARCSVGARCGCIYCTVCARIYRVWVASQALALFATGVPAKVVVVLLKEVDAASLTSVDPKRILDSLRKDLVRFGLPPALGGLEVAYKPDRDVWVIHVHLLVFGEADGAIERLRKAYRKRITRAVLAQQIEDPVKQITYLFKFVTYYRAGRMRQKFPMKQTQLEQLCAWTEGRRFTDFLFLIGFQKRGSIGAGKSFKNLLARRD